MKQVNYTIRIHVDNWTSCPWRFSKKVGSANLMYSKKLGFFLKRILTCFQCEIRDYRGCFLEYAPLKD